MFPLDVMEDSDLGTPSLKRSVTPYFLNGEDVILSQENGNFFADDNYLIDAPFFDLGTGDFNSELNNYSETCLLHKLEEPQIFEELTEYSDRGSAWHSMPYMFPAQIKITKNEICHYTAPGASRFDEKTFCFHPLAVKEENEGIVVSRGSPKSISPQEIFCRVPSRTAVQKPKLLTVTVGEVFRRVFGPELMNVSLLGSYLRRAKEKDGGKTLRDELMKRGMFVPLGRRKNGSTTTWTCFVEEETQAMAADLDLASRKFFPVQDFAQTIREKTNASDVELRASAFCVRNILRVMRQIFLDDRSPVHGHEEGELILSKELQDGLFRFSCATHGFGSLALTSAIDLFDALMEALVGDYGFCVEDGYSNSSGESI